MILLKSDTLCTRNGHLLAPIAVETRHRTDLPWVSREMLVDDLVNMFSNNIMTFPTKRMSIIVAILDEILADNLYQDSVANGLD